jgi:lipopolysaccharide transport system ATP-binding protein
MHPAISARNISKYYCLGGPSSGMLRESIMRAATMPLRQLQRLGAHRSSDARSDPAAKDLWALRDVSFDVAPGEAVGVIGRNGAGKSTLLKVLSRITGPTTGRIAVRGRMGSLLEVGTGFHPELSGRENVFLNGAIMGMTRKEIARKFARIVEFSEIGRFIDTPVKRYSSGMYVRLAFAVAAHMEPHILIIDEVLSVGDLAFQRKCMDFAKRLVARDVTLLLVSHNMFAVKSMCDRSLYMSAGQLKFDGPTDEAVRLYDADSASDTLTWAQHVVGRDSRKCPIYIESAEFLGESGRSEAVFDHGARMRVRLRFHARERIENPNFTVAFIRSDNVACCNYSSGMDGLKLGAVEGDGVVEVVTPPLKLVSELYTAHVLVWDSSFQRLYCAQAAGKFNIRHDVFSTEFGVFHEPAEWRDAAPAREASTAS